MGKVLLVNLKMNLNPLGGSDRVVQFHADNGLRPEIFMMTREEWERMEKPEVITIGVEPGDKLNEPELPKGR